MGDMVIVAYQPKPGQDAALLELVRQHVPTLRALGLATDRPPLAMRNAAGVIVEVFEWREGAIQRAHSLPEIGEMWAKFAAASDYVPAGTLPEMGQLFSQFEPVDL